MPTHPLLTKFTLLTLLLPPFLACQSTTPIHEGGARESSAREKGFREEIAREAKATQRTGREGTAGDETNEVSDTWNRDFRRERQANAPPQTGFSSRAQEIERSLGVR